MIYGYLAIAIIAEVIATTALKATEEFTRAVPSAIAVIGYCVAIYYMTLVLRVIPVGITYAVWSGLGIVLVTITTYFLYKQTLDMAALLGIGLIISGVLVIHLFSKSVSA